jgi:hypothetical protein
MSNIEFELEVIRQYFYDKLKRLDFEMIGFDEYTITIQFDKKYSTEIWIGEDVHFYYQDKNAPKVFPKIDKSLSNILLPHITNFIAKSKIKAISLQIAKMNSILNGLESSAKSSG